MAIVPWKTVLLFAASSGWVYAIKASLFPKGQSSDGLYISILELQVPGSGKGIYIYP